MLHSFGRSFRISRADLCRLMETILIAFAGGELFAVMRFQQEGKKVTSGFR